MPWYDACVPVRYAEQGSRDYLLPSFVPCVPSLSFNGPGFHFPRKLPSNDVISASFFSGSCAESSQLLRAAWPDLVLVCFVAAHPNAPLSGHVTRFQAPYQFVFMGACDLFTGPLSLSPLRQLPGLGWASRFSCSGLLARLCAACVWALLTLSRRGRVESFRSNRGFGPEKKYSSFQVFLFNFNFTGDDFFSNPSFRRHAPPTLCELSASEAPLAMAAHSSSSSSPSSFVLLPPLLSGQRSPFDVRIEIERKSRHGRKEQIVLTVTIKQYNTYQVRVKMHEEVNTIRPLRTIKGVINCEKCQFKQGLVISTN